MTRSDYVRSETDMFREYGYDVSVQSATRAIYHPLSTISQNSPLEFFIQGNDTQYIDLSKTKIKLRCKVVGANGKDIAAQTDPTILLYAPVNYIAASAFDKVTVKINESEITPKSSLYPYQAYLETVFSYGSDFKKGQAEAGGFYRVKDEANRDDDGWKSRNELCDASKTFEVIARPHGEIFNYDKYIFPGLDLRIAFHRSPDSFVMECVGTSKQNVQFHILEAQLLIQKVTLLPSIQLHQLKTWQSQPIVYQGSQVLMKSYSLPKGTLQHTNEQLLNGVLPERLIVGLVSTSNVQGTYDTNPFNFQDHGLEQIIVTCNSEVQTQYTINMDKTNNRFLDGFISIFDSMGLTNCDPGVDIRVNEYKAGKTLYGFDLRSKSSEGHPLPRHGNVSIFIKFNTALADSVTVILYPEYPVTMNIDHNKRVTFKDFAHEY